MTSKHAILIILTLALCLGWSTSQAREDDLRWDSDYILPGSAMSMKKKPPSLDALAQRAEKGEVLAQVRMGERFFKGTELPQHFARARYWFLRAAKQGNPQAMLQVAALYDQGKGGPKDRGQAYFWYMLAAANGVRQALPLRNRLVEWLDPKLVGKLQDQALHWKPIPERTTKP